MHLKRWITAIIAVPLIFLAVFSGPSLLLSLILIVVSFIALWEFFRIAFKDYEKISLFLALPAYLISVGIIACAHLKRIDLILLILCMDLLTVALISMPLFKTNPRLPDLITKQILGVVYVPIFISFLVFLRHDPEGKGWVFFILCLVAAGDVGAYYVGSYLGKHKLCPSVSPNKTIEGSLGGLFSNLLIGLMFSLFFISGLNWPVALIIAVIVGMAGQLGDLFESQFKRAAGIKDSGALLPGHGGMLDRIDALLFASPVAFILKEIFL
ncbi:MAG: phosphatidate cytidylyltransferase [Desulfobacteraceae bacterium]|jgi:phosphatidate cytidylyltransferase